MALESKGAKKQILNDEARNRDEIKQRYILILDITKAFDTVLLKRLMPKLEIHIKI